MQRLEVSGAVRLIYRSLGVKRSSMQSVWRTVTVLFTSISLVHMSTNLIIAQCFVQLKGNYSSAIIYSHLQGVSILKHVLCIFVSCKLYTNTHTHMYRVILSLEAPNKFWEKYYRIWRNAFKCAWM